jgi:hypothetical protein
LYSSYDQYERVESFYISKYLLFQEYLFPLVHDLGAPTRDEMIRLRRSPSALNLIKYNFSGTRHDGLQEIASKNSELLKLLQTY